MLVLGFSAEIETLSHPRPVCIVAENHGVVPARLLAPCWSVETVCVCVSLFPFHFLKIILSHRKVFFWPQASATSRPPFDLQCDGVFVAVFPRARVRARLRGMRLHLEAKLFKKHWV